MIEVRVTRHDMANMPREFFGHERLWLVQLLIERGIKFRNVRLNLQIDDLEPPCEVFRDSATEDLIVRQGESE